jgi:hypothetical protein
MSRGRDSLGRVDASLGAESASPPPPRDADGISPSRDAPRVQVTAPIGARKRRLPASVLAAARPTESAKAAKTPGSGRGRGRAAAKASPEPAHVVREPLYDVVSASESDEPAPKPAAVKPALAPSTLSSSAIEAVKDVTDEALMRVARARAGTKPPAPPKPAVVTHADDIDASCPAEPSETERQPTRAPAARAPSPPKPPPPKCAVASANINVSSFDDVFSLFTGTARTQPTQSRRSPSPPEPASRRQTFTQALACGDDPSQSPPRATGKPKSSFAALLAANVGDVSSDDDDF